jgi:hypothetical protein
MTGLLRRPVVRAFLSLAAACLTGTAALAAPAAVTVENQTRPTACAEEDNVSLTLSGRGIARFRVEALQPPYLAGIHDDRTAPDFSGCNFDGGVHPTDPSFSFEPRSVVLHEDSRWRIVGMTLPRFWRPNRVPVRVGARSGDDFHLLQVFARQGQGRKPMEVLVMYPADGYWRIKPMALPGFGDGAYGSSFLMGPVEPGLRPVVDISSITVEPHPLSIRLRFVDGGSAEVRVVEASRERTALDVRLHPPTHAGRPFAVLRSMYVAPDNADMSVVGWRAAAGAPWQQKPLPEVSTLEAQELLFGRTQPSRHNTSAPDIRFSAFGH